MDVVIKVDGEQVQHATDGRTVELELEHATVTIADHGNAVAVAVRQHSTGDTHGVTVPHAEPSEQAEA